MRVAEITKTQTYSGIAVIVFDIAIRVAKDGYEVDIISPQNPFFSTKGKKNQNESLKFIKIANDSGNKITKNIKLYHKLVTIIKKNKYDIVHIHSDHNSFTIISILAAAKAKSKIIFHAHNQRLGNRAINYLSKRIIRKHANLLMSCSDLAAEAMLPKGKEWHFIANGIATNNFAFSAEKRKKYRKLFNVSDDEIFIGNIGRIEKQKNQRYLIQILDEMHRNDIKAKLLLIGKGALEKAVKKEIVDRKLQDNVIHLEESNNVNEIISALDYFALPSLHEGLPIVAIEAQANGLNTIISDKTSKLTIITDRCIRRGISKNNISDWTKILSQKPNIANRKDYYRTVSKAGFDISSSAKKVKTLYDEVHNG